MLHFHMTNPSLLKFDPPRTALCHRRYCSKVRISQWGATDSQTSQWGCDRMQKFSLRVLRLGDD